MPDKSFTVPAHIGIIMDGNGRWAKKRGLPRTMGHRQGAKVFSDIAKYAREIGVKYLTVYTFSTENFTRPPDEVNMIMGLLRDYLGEVKKNQDEDVTLHFIGDRTLLPKDVREQIDYIEANERQNGKITVNIALGYGGRDELVHACRRIAQQVKEGTISAEAIDEAMVGAHLYTAGQPDPDMIIRPGGEMRLSNFLIWQSAYSELVVMDVLWPDFTSAHLDQAIREYNSRERRFGGSE